MPNHRRGRQLLPCLSGGRRAAFAALAILSGCTIDAPPPPAAKGESQGAADPACATGLGTGLAVTMADGVPMVSVQINHQPATLVLASLARDTALTSAARDRLGLPPVAAVRIREQAPLSAVDVQVDALDVGPYHTSHVAVPMLADGAAQGGDGVLGSDILDQFDLLLDLPHQRVVLFPPRPCVTPPPALTAVTLPRVATSQRPGRTAFMVELDGTGVSAVIDTAAPQSVIRLAAGMRAAPGGFSQLVIGDETLPSPHLQTADMQPRAGTQADLRLGTDYLATHLVWVSAAAGSVHVVTSLTQATP